MALPATLTYNGINLVLGRVIQCVQEPEYDDLNNVLWVNFDLSVRCVINPYATASGLGGFNLGVGGAGGGDAPGLSIATLRRALLAPRGYLVVKVGNDTVWEAPQTTTAGALLPCDATGGPTPVAFTVEQVVGAKSIIALYRIRFALNECVGLGDSEVSGAGAGGPLPPPTLLSHVWDCEESLDEQALSTRVISGEAVFRRDFLEAHLPRLTADDFRGHLRHPIPPYFQRLPVRVKATRDGQGIQYQITDVERPWGIDPDRGILRLEGYLERSFNWFGFTNPISEGVFHAEAWGQPRCKSATLIDALVTLFITMRGSTGAPVFRPNAVFDVGPYRYPFTAVSVRVDFPRRHATLTQRVRLGGRVAGGADLVSGSGPVDADYPEDMGSLGGPSQQFNPIPVNDSILRGDRLLRLVTQALSDPCSGPPDPPPPQTPYVSQGE